MLQNILIYLPFLSWYAVNLLIQFIISFAFQRAFCEQFPVIFFSPSSHFPKYMCTFYMEENIVCNIFPSIVEFYCYCNFVEIYFMPQNAVYPSICPMDIYRIYFCCHRIECFLNVSEILLADDVEFSHVLAGSMSCYSIHS